MTEDTLNDTGRPDPIALRMFREEAGLGVCSDPRREFGRDYRILELLDALACADARTAALARDRDALAAKITRVETLADELDREADRDPYDSISFEGAHNRLRAALAGPDDTARDTQLDEPRGATVAEAIAAWEANGPTSMTVALMAEAVYRAADVLAICEQVEANPVGWGGDMAVSLARTIRNALDTGEQP